MHLSGTFNLIINQLKKLNRVLFERITFSTISIAVLPVQTFIEFVADSLNYQVEYNGFATKASKQFGKDWKDQFKRAVYFDYLSALYFCWRVQNEDTVFWERNSEYFSNNPLLIGSRNLIRILMAKTNGFEVIGTGFKFYYEFVLRDPTYIIDTWGPSVCGPEDYAKLKASGFRSPAYNGTLKFIKDNYVKDLDMASPNFVLNGEEPMCIADLIVTTDSTENISKYHVLRNDGVSTYSMALNLNYRTQFSNNTVGGINLLDLFYISYSGEADPDLRATQIELWLGFRFAMPDLRTSGPSSSSGGRGPSGNGVPSTPSPGAEPANGGGNVETDTGDNGGEIYPVEPITGSPGTITPYVTTQGIPLGSVDVSTNTDMVTKSVRDIINVSNDINNISNNSMYNGGFIKNALRATAVGLLTGAASKFGSDFISRPSISTSESEGLTAGLNLGPMQLNYSKGKSRTKKELVRAGAVKAVSEKRKF